MTDEMWKMREASVWDDNAFFVLEKTQHSFHYRMQWGEHWPLENKEYRNERNSWAP